ncbi:ABC transporter ATP-binding protein [Amedibacillus sp. YH-ame10]
MTRLQLNHLDKNYGNIKAVRDISLDIKEKAFIVLAGPSGCGKTTLLHMIAGFLKCDKGSIMIDGNCIDERVPALREIAMVFQDAALFPDMSVQENIEIGLAQSGLQDDVIQERVQEMAALVDISELLNRKAKTLSSGQRQRVSIARALVRRPKVFLMDEPLSALDARLKSQLRIEIAMLYQKMDATFLYVTHDQIEAMTMADILIVMKDGKFQQVGTPLDIYHHPKNLFTASFLGKYEINQFKASVHNQQVVFKESVLCEARGVLDEQIIIGVRPEHLFMDIDHGYLGQIVLVENLGDELYYHIEWEDQLLMMKGALSDGLRCGDVVNFNFRVQDAFYFYASTQERFIPE